MPRSVVGVVLDAAVVAGFGSSAGDDSPSAADITREDVAASFGRLDKIVRSAMSETGGPGVAVAVVYDDEVVYKKGYGVRNTETRKPVEPKTVFQIASLSKAVSSTVMSGLVGDGVIAWDDPIAEYFEYLQTGAVATDWLPLWTERFAGIYGEPQDWSTPPDNAAPARPDDAYIGAYANEYVGEVTVVAGGGGLEIIEGPDGRTFPLEHWDGDTFIYAHDPELREHRATVTFAVGDGNVATTVTLSAFDGAGLGTLTRV